MNVCCRYMVLYLFGIIHLKTRDTFFYNGTCLHRPERKCVLLNNNKIAACDTLAGKNVNKRHTNGVGKILPVSLSALSHNRISVLAEQSFRTLPFLHTLLLDHNLLTDQALQEGALTNLTRLEVLALGHNLISMVCCKYIIKNNEIR